MKLEGSIKEELQQRINDIIEDDFLWCKEQIIRTRELVGIEDAEIWMKYRNGMDRLLLLQRDINLGEFPSSDLTFGRIDVDNRIAINSIDPNETLTYSEYLFRNCGVEAWVQATEISIGILSMRINSFSYDGDKAKAKV